MQNTNKVEQGQSFIDMVCMLSGSYEEVVNASILNGKSITANLAIGEEISVEKTLDKEVSTQLSKQKPATEVKEIISTARLEGIGYWIIDVDFIVS